MSQLPLLATPAQSPGQPDDVPAPPLVEQADDSPDWDGPTANGNPAPVGSRQDANPADPPSLAPPPTSSPNPPAPPPSYTTVHSTSTLSKSCSGPSRAPRTMTVLMPSGKECGDFSTRIEHAQYIFIIHSLILCAP